MTDLLLILLGLVIVVIMLIVTHGNGLSPREEAILDHIRKTGRAPDQHWLDWSKDFEDMVEGRKKT